MPDGPGAPSPIADYDRDSIHILPLMILPLASAGLRRARMLKNVRLETRIELYRADGAGSGQIAVEEVPSFFNASDTLKKDVEILTEVSRLKAFDCYSVRRGLRAMNLEPLDDTLTLSATKRRELFPFMRNLTRPLIRHLYGAGDIPIDDTERLMEMIRKPDMQVVRPRLQEPADSLGTTIEELPDMLEDYGEVFLSLSYYRGYFTQVVPKVNDMLAWMRDVADTAFVRNDANVAANFRVIEQLMLFLTKSLTRRFNHFDRNVVIHWDQVSVDNFNGVREAILAHHSSLAEVLCGLDAKTLEWEVQFPNRGGSPDKRADFLIADIKPGLDQLHRVERAAPGFK